MVGIYLMPHAVYSRNYKRYGVAGLPFAPKHGAEGLPCPSDGWQQPWTSEINLVLHYIIRQAAQQGSPTAQNRPTAGGPGFEMHHHISERRMLH